MKRTWFAPFGALLLTLFPVTIAAPLVAAPLVACAAAPVAPQQTSQEWIAAGDLLRAAEDWPGALEAYERASQLNGGRIESRVWELRCWMELGRINDALDAIDVLAKENAAESTLDYLYGMAFARRAELNVAAGVTDSSVAMNFGDAVDLLSRATQVDPDTFGDALPHLAQAAYNSQRNDVARAAAEAAVERFGDRPKYWLLLGRIALSQFVVARGDGEGSAEADEHWNASIAAFKQGVEILGNPTDPTAQALLGNLHVQLGYAYGWKSEQAEAAALAFGQAMEWNPGAVDYGSTWNVVGIERFTEITQQAVERFVARAGDEDARAATPLWFLGHARFQQEEWEAAEAAFTKSVEKWPAYAAAWFYVGRARYSRGDHEGAIEAFRKHWQVSPTELVATVQSDAEQNIAILDWLVGQAAAAGNTLDAAFLSEVCAESKPDEPRYWNNLGLFLRDEGETMLREMPEERVDERQELFERAYAAYSRALALRPDDPALLNDTALMLHYHLRRDLDRAVEMYERSHARAAEELARDDLDEESRSLYEIALRDSKNNLALLEEELAGG